VSASGKTAIGCAAVLLFIAIAGVVSGLLGYAAFRNGSSK
jgi:hypothetical protein